LRNAIEIKAEGEELHYQREPFWNDEQFSKLLELKEEIETKEIDSFKKPWKDTTDMLLIIR